MGSGMANLGLEFTIKIGVAYLLLDETFRLFLGCLDEGHMSVVGVLAVQTIRTHGEVCAHTIRLVQNKLAPRGTVIGDA